MHILFLPKQSITTASQRWRLGAWDVQEFSLLAAGPMENTSTAGKSWQHSRKPPRERGKLWEGNSLLRNCNPQVKATFKKTLTKYKTTTPFGLWTRGILAQAHI